MRWRARCRGPSRGKPYDRRAPSPDARTAWESCRSLRLRSARSRPSSCSPSSPGLAFLPAPLAACALFLDAEIEFLDVFLLEEPGAGIGHDDAPDLQHVAKVGGLQGHVGVLLDQQDGDAALAVDA